MFTVRVDPHVHLYDSYPIETWLKAAVDNLGVTDSSAGVIIVVDRTGQDSFAMLRAQAGVGAWTEHRGEHSSGEEALAAMVRVSGKSLYVIRGVQYVSSERLEVLGLGVPRSCPDGRPCRELISLIQQAGGIAYMPWSPGKWLGPRGLVIKQLIQELSPSELVFGDIAIHARFLLPSALLELARGAGYGVIPGTDPLPRAQDAGLVGTYGVELEVEDRVDLRSIVPCIIRKIACDFNMLKVWGRPNSLVTAARRFVSTL